MIHPVVKFGDDVLERKAEPVTEFDGKLGRLLDEMFESMYAASGVGLAAPQIGISRRMAVIDITCGKDPDARIVLINPEIIAVEGHQKEEEGCLSLPSFRETVKRPLAHCAAAGGGLRLERGAARAKCTTDQRPRKGSLRPHTEIHRAL